MINCDDARSNLDDVIDYRSVESFKRLHDFIDEVEALLKHNSIKQTPALFKPKE